MKSKRILITYLNNGNMSSQVSKEVMFNRVLNEMIDDGREVKHTTLTPNSKSVLFEDGSKIYLYPISVSNKALKVTHIFLDESIKSIPNGMELVTESVIPCLMTGRYETFDTSGKQFSFFSFSNGELSIK